MLKRLHVKYQLFLSDFNETYNSLDRFSKKAQISNCIKSVQWEQSCSMRTDRRTNMTKLIIAFRNFVNAPENWTTLKYLRVSYNSYNTLTAGLL